MDISLKQAEKIGTILHQIQGIEFKSWDISGDKTLIFAEDIEGDQYRIEFIPHQSRRKKG